MKEKRLQKSLLCVAIENWEFGIGMNDEKKLGIRVII